MEFEIKPCGDSALTVIFGSEICYETYEKISAFCKALDGKGHSGIIEYVPSYCAVNVQYDAVKIGFDELCEMLMELAQTSQVAEGGTNKIVEIPVCYGLEYGPDLAFVASHNGMSEQEVIRVHTEAVYPVYMMGFTPGFPYLGGMDSSIATPRLKSPRVAIPAGSVGIAGEQTGIYPIASPGGWQLIGKTPLKLFDLSAEQPFLIKAGDRIRFVAITPQQFVEIAKEGK